MAIDFGAIRANYPLEQIVSESVELRRSGPNKVGQCPFHADRSPSFVVYQNQTYHCFGCGVHGDVIDYVSESRKLSTAEAVRHLTGGDLPEFSEEDRRRRAYERKQAEAERERNIDNAKQEARARWQRALPVNGVGSGYLVRKNVAPYGCRREGENLLVPIFDGSGLITSVQLIPPEAGAKKLFHGGAPVAGGRMMLGDAKDGPIVIVEGFATGATVQAATGFLVVVAFSQGNMPVVAEDIAARHPGREIIIGADTNGIAKAEAAAAASGGRVVVPDLQGADGTDFNDQAAHYGLDDVKALFAAPEAPERAIRATAFTWRPEADLPKRQWLYGKHLLRKFLSVDVAAGGVGKSSLKIGEALALASGKDIYGQKLHEGPLRVWLYNLEDPNEETERRIHATAKRFQFKPDDFGDRLYVDSGRDQRCVIAEETPAGVKIMRPVVDAILAELQERRIDVLVVDPFVSSHMVSENDNMAIDLVAKEWARIADQANCSINLVHHIRKANGQEATADSARGASSLIGAARSVMVFNRMTREEAEKVGLASEEARFFFRVDNDKANLAPPGSTTWYRMNNVDLDNGDSVGVACPWSPPDLFSNVTTADLMRMQRLVGQGKWRESMQAKEWVGIPVAEALRLDANDPKDKRRINEMVKEWVRNGILDVIEDEDATRRKRKFVEVGNWVSE